MAKQPNLLPRELKNLDMKEIDPYLLHVRELRGRNSPPTKQPSTGPNSDRSIINDPTMANNSTPPFNHPGDPEAGSPVQIQSSSELYTDKVDMIDDYQIGDPEIRPSNPLIWLRHFLLGKS